MDEGQVVTIKRTIDNSKPSPVSFGEFVTTVFASRSALRKKHIAHAKDATEAYCKVKAQHQAHPSVVGKKHMDIVSNSMQKLTKDSERVSEAEKNRAFWKTRRWMASYGKHARDLVNRSITTTLLVAQAVEPDDPTTEIAPKPTPPASRPRASSLVNATHVQSPRSTSPLGSPSRHDPVAQRNVDFVRLFDDHNLEQAAYYYEGETKLGYPKQVCKALASSLQQITAWFRNADASNSVYWLWKEERGRDDVLRYVAETCEGIQNAAFSCFFFPSRPTVDFASKLKEGFAPTIVQDFASRIPGFEHEIHKHAIHERLVFGQPFQQQFKSLFVGPYESLYGGDYSKAGKILLIVDGLDRCPEAYVDGILKAFHSISVFHGIRMYFLISSARVPWMINTFNVWKLKPFAVEGDYVVSIESEDDTMTM